MRESSDVARLRQLYHDHVGELVGYALRRVESAEDAADVVAETFLVAWRRRVELPAGKEGRLWLYGCARLALANQRRGGYRRQRLADRLRANIEAIPLDSSDNSAAAMLVRQAVAHLADDDRELLWLTSWEGLAPTEIAIAFGLPAATVRTRLRRARSRLRDELKRLGFDEPMTHSTTQRHSESGGQSPVTERKD